MFARIYQPAPSPMQSGRAKCGYWLLEFAGPIKGMIDPFTGTYRSASPERQLELKFDTKEAAIAYAKANTIPHRVEPPKAFRPQHRSYAENFAFDRKIPWTH